MSFSVPNDTLYSQQWYLTDPLTGIWSDRVFDFVYNAKPTQPVQPVIVAVVDSGVDYNHPDLQDKVLVSRGFDWVNWDDNAMDDNGHGTHVAGIIAATVNNSLGVAGVAGSVYARILPQKVLDSGGNGAVLDIAAAIEDSANQGAAIINLSLGVVDQSTGLPVHSDLLQEAVAYAQGKGALIVAAAGNEGVDLLGSPADIPGVITVGATQKTVPWRTNFSNSGSELDVVAPGDYILSTCTSILPDCGPSQTYPGYQFVPGTSMAAPLVSGVAAVVQAVYHQYSAYNLGAAVLSGADDLSQNNAQDYVGWDPFTGRGMLNAWNALTVAPPGAVAMTGPSNGATVSGTTHVAFRVPVPEMVVNVAVYLDDTSAAPLSVTPIHDYLNNISYAQYPDLLRGMHAGEGTFGFDWTPPSDASGRHQLIAVATNLGGLEIGRDFVVVNIQLPSSGGGGGTGGGGGGGGGAVTPPATEPQAASGEGDATTSVSVKDAAGTYEMEVPAGAVEAGAGARVKVDVVPIAAAQVEELLKAAKVPEGVTSIGKAFEFKAEVTVDGKTQAVTGFAKPVTFTVNLSADELKKVGDPEKIGVFRLNDDGTLTFVGGKLVNGKLVVQLYGFSRYVLAEVKVAFNDMKDHWAKADVELMGAKYVVKGLPGGGFDPGGAVTRAQFAAMLVRAMGLPAARTALGFKDVKGGAWYYGELATAVKAGLIQGFGDGTFRPDAPVTREQVAAMVARALRASGKAAALGEAAAARALLPFADAGRVSSWAAGDLALAIKEGILQGRTATSLAPATGASRAEAAAMIARFWRK